MAFVRALDEAGNVGEHKLTFAAPDDAEALAKRVAGVMKRRGFTRFAEFQPFLLKAYRERKPGQGVSDLYPQLIAWFAAHNE